MDDDMVQQMANELAKVMWQLKDMNCDDPAYDNLQYQAQQYRHRLYSMGIGRSSSSSSSMSTAIEWD